METYPKVAFSFGTYTFRCNFEVKIGDHVICIVKSDYMIGRVVDFMTEEEYDHVTYILKPVVALVSDEAKKVIESRANAIWVE